MTQDQAADFIGVSRRQYSRWETHEGTPYYSSIEKIARAYGISTADLTIDPADQLDEPWPVPRDDFTRLEAKVDLILEHLGLDPTSALPDLP